jgi:hypothetical protein
MIVADADRIRTPSESRRPTSTTAGRRPPVTSFPPSADGLLRLQRTAGNAVVARILAESGRRAPVDRLAVQREKGRPASPADTAAVLWELVESWEEDAPSIEAALADIDRCGWAESKSHTDIVRAASERATLGAASLREGLDHVPDPDSLKAEAAELAASLAEVTRTVGELGKQVSRWLISHTESQLDEAFAVEFPQLSDALMSLKAFVLLTSVGLVASAIAIPPLWPLAVAAGAFGVAMSMLSLALRQSQILRYGSDPDTVRRLAGREYVSGGEPDGLLGEFFGSARWTKFVTHPLVAWLLEGKSQAWTMGGLTGTLGSVTAMIAGGVMLGVGTVVGLIDLLYAAYSASKEYDLVDRASQTEHEALESVIGRVFDAKSLVTARVHVARTDTGTWITRADGDRFFIKNDGTTLVEPYVRPPQAVAHSNRSAPFNRGASVGKLW